MMIGERVLAEAEQLTLIPLSELDHELVDQIVRGILGAPEGDRGGEYVERVPVARFGSAI